jgi:hypothetical protein
MGELAYVAALLAGVLFVPSMALALGALSNSKKLFEVVFLMIWYMGTIEHLTPLDFLGTSADTINAGMPMIYSLVGIGFLLVAFITRRQQLVL